MLAFVGVICLVGSTVLYKRMHPSSDLLVVTAFQIVAASLFLIPFALLLEGAPSIPLTAPILASFAYLILMLSIGASFLWFWVLRHGEATRVSAYYFLTPVFGLALAALILGEPLGWRDAAGLVAICSGIALVVRG